MNFLMKSTYYLKKEMQSGELMTIQTQTTQKQPKLTKLQLIEAAFEEDRIEKIYHTVGNVAKAFDCAPSKIRFWCAQFNVNPKRNKHGRRSFQKEDIVKLKTIHHL